MSAIDWSQFSWEQLDQIRQNLWPDDEALAAQFRETETGRLQLIALEDQCLATLRDFLDNGEMTPEQIRAMLEGIASEQLAAVADDDPGRADFLKGQAQGQAAVDRFLREWEAAGANRPG